MSLRDYLAIAGRWWWLVVLGCIVAGVSAYLVTQQMTRVYRADALLLVNQAQNPGSVTYQDILGSQQLTKTYAELVTSNLNLEEAAKKLEQPDLTVAQLKGKVSASAEDGTQLIRVSAEDPSRHRAALIANTVANTFVDYVQVAQVAGQQNVQGTGLNTVFVAETADTPGAPVRPNLISNVTLAVLLGLVVVTVVVALVEYLDDDIQGKEDLEEKSLAFLGTVYWAKAPKNGQKREWVPSLIRDDPHSSWAESFRQVQTSLAFALTAGNHKTLLVTSANAGEGKSTTAANVAAALAESSKRVLLIDGDLRKPDSHRYFELPNASGLTSAFLAEEAAGPSFVKRVNAHLSVLTSGPIPPNPSGLLNSTRMHRLLQSVSTDFDVVVVDSPPVLGLADASVWAGLADGVLLVARKGKTRRGHFQEAVAAIEATKKPLVGVIINGGEPRKTSPYYYGYRYDAERSTPRS